MKLVNFKNELKKIPDDLVLGRSNAFPWIVNYKDKFYLTFRSAIAHIPIIGSRVIVVSRGNNLIENIEMDFKMDRDLRESRLARLNDNLFLYFSSRQKLNPFGNDWIFMSEKNEKGWSKSHKIYKHGFTLYSIKNIDGTLYMSCYKRKNNSECDFIMSHDGANWSEVFSGKKLGDILTCETDFIFKDGFWYFISRNEFGKFNRYGSEIYKFDGDGGLIEHIHSDLKFDGPYLFEKDGEIFLVARRNLSNNGKFLLPIKPVRFFGYWISNLYYWLTAKKTVEPHSKK